MNEDNWIAKPIYCSRSGRTQRCDWFFQDQYAFHEWTTFPSLGKIFAAAALGEKSPEVLTCYWLSGHGDTREELIAELAKVGLNPAHYHYLEEPYGDGFFPICNEFEHAKEYYEAQTKQRIL